MGQNARVVARYATGEPAAVIARFGRGKTLTLGTYLGVAYEHHHEPAAQRFFAGLLDWAGVMRPVSVSGGDAEVRLLESGKDHVLFAFNHQERAIETAITLREPYSGIDLISGAAVPAGRTFRKRVEPGDVWVMRLTPQ